MVVCILLYCILASPFFLIAGIFCLLTGRPFSVAVLKFIRTFGCFMIRTWYSVYVPVRLDDFSGGANHNSMESWWFIHLEAATRLPRGGISACNAM